MLCLILLNIFYSNCLGTLEKALLENMLPINKQELWYIYLDTMISLSQSQHMKDEKIKDYVNNKIELVFQQAYDNDALNKPDYFIFWVQTLIILIILYFYKCIMKLI